MLPSTFSSSNHVTGSRERVHSSDCALCPPWVPLGQLFPLSPNVSPIVEAQEESQEAEDVEEDCSVEAIREWALCEEVVARMSSNGHKLALKRWEKEAARLGNLHEIHLSYWDHWDRHSYHNILAVSSTQRIPCLPLLTSLGTCLSSSAVFSHQERCPSNLEV